MGNCYGSPVNNHSTPVTSTNINSKQNGVAGRSVVAGAKRPAGNISSKRNSTADQSSTSTREFVAPPPEVAAAAAAAPSDTSLPIDQVPKLKEFTLVELKKCTQNFKPATILGEGGFGRVFKGWVDRETYAPSRVGIGMAVAVKKSNPDSFQSHQQWQAEVNFLGKYRHPNLVRLLGHCCEENQFLLVYEYMQKGSLENHLFRKGQEPLRWETRLKIAIGAARGLAFLHTSDKVIYRDFKSSNILLDQDYNAKLSDFGLAKLGPINGNSHVTTRILGTYGYAAPEYVATGHLYVKSDVYGFGVVLLEMLTGLPALDNNRPTPEQNLVEWLRPSLHKKKELKKMMDPGLGDEYSLRGACLAAELILKCLESEPKKRPSMEEVVVILENVNDIKEKPKINAKASVSFHHRSPNHQRPSHGHAPTSKRRY